MGIIMDNFFEAINEASKTPVDVLKDSIKIIPPVIKNETGIGMETTIIMNEPLNAIDAAEKAVSSEMKLAETVSAVKDGEEQYLRFDTQDIKLPYYFKSFDEMATAILGNIFQAEGIKSINTDHFGEFLKNTNPRGFTKAVFGNHEFYIQNNSDRMIYVFEFLALAKNDLLSKRKFECDLVREIEINHGIAYTLVITPKELMDIQKSYPDYKICYVSNDNIKDLKLIIKV